MQKRFECEWQRTVISRPSSARMSAAYVEASSADAISTNDIVEVLKGGCSGNREALQRISGKAKAIENVTVDARKVVRESAQARQ